MAAKIGDFSGSEYSSSIHTEPPDRTIRSVIDLLKQTKRSSADVTTLRGRLSECDLGELSAQLIEDGDDIVLLIERIAALIDSDMDTGELNALLQEAHYYLERTELSSSVPIKTRLTISLNKLSTILENILEVLGIADCFKSAEGALHTDYKAQKLMLLVSLFILLSGTLLPLLGVTKGGAIVGGLFLGIILLSLIYPYIKPAPSELPQAENLTYKFLLGTLPIWIKGGILEKRVHEIGSILARGDYKFPLLKGSPLLTTQLVYKFVEAVAQGALPALKGCNVFHIHVADLTHTSDISGGANTVLERIKRKMGGHADKCILILDGMEAVCQGGNLADLITANLHGNFPYVIGMTTEEGHTKLGEKAPLMSHFDLVDIQNIDIPEKKRVLVDYLLKKAPHLLWEQPAMEGLTQHPLDQALHLLAAHIEKMGPTQKTRAQLALEQLHLEEENAIVNRIISPDTATLQTREEKGVDESQRIKKLFLIQRQLHPIRSIAYKIILKREKASDQERREAWLLYHFVLPAIREYLKKEGEALGIHTIIDSIAVEMLKRSGLSDSTLPDSATSPHMGIGLGLLPQTSGTQLS